MVTTPSTKTRRQGSGGISLPHVRSESLLAARSNNYSLARVHLPARLTPENHLDPPRKLIGGRLRSSFTESNGDGFTRQNPDPLQHT